MYQYPYGDTQQLNLDWILTKIKELEAGSGNIDMEEVATTLISATYNASNAYRRYDYCYYNGKLYRCLSDTTGAFNPADWQEVLIGDDIPILTRLINAVDASLTTLQGQVDDIDSDDVDNASNVTGTTVTDALDNLNGAINHIQGQITSFIENNDTSTRTYYRGAYLVWKGDLYRVIATINLGDSFEIGTNIEALTLESVLVTLTNPISVSTEADLKRVSFNFSTAANIPLGSTGVTLEAYAKGEVISPDGQTGVLIAVGYNGNIYAAFLSGGIFVKAQMFDNRATSITLTADQTYVSSTSGISCKRTGNIVTFSGTIVLAASAITNNLLLSGFPAPSAAVDIFGTIVDATDTSQRGKAGRYRIKTDGTLVPWYNSWGASDQGSTITFNTTYLI